jgi:hypothetical protein
MPIDASDANGLFWPISAVQAMKFTRGRSTAVCDPKLPLTFV